MDLPETGCCDVRRVDSPRIASRKQARRSRGRGRPGSTLRELCPREERTPGSVRAAGGRGVGARREGLLLSEVALEGAVVGGDQVVGAPGGGGEGHSAGRLEAGAPCAE